MEGIRVAAGVLLWRGTQAAPEFLLLRNARHGTWGFAKGHLEDGEDLVGGALRECREETSLALNPADLLPQFADTSIYLTAGGKRKRVVLFLAARPTQDAAVMRSHEHDAHEWWTLETAMTRLAYEELRRSLVRAASRLAREAT